MSSRTASPAPPASTVRYCVYHIPCHTRTFILVYHIISYRTHTINGRRLQLRGLPHVRGTVPDHARRHGLLRVPLRQRLRGPARLQARVCIMYLVYKYVGVCMHIHTYIHVYVYKYVDMCAFVYIHICTRIYTHTLPV